MKFFFTLILLLSATSVYSSDSFYDLRAKKIDGDTLDFIDLKGKKLLIVNVASYCGYTYQYEELQSLYSQYGGENFEIIGFPANNFSNQEPGSDSSIYEFCTDKYKVTFTMMSKISVKGSDKHPVYQWLTMKSKNGVADQEVLWNFQKYLVNEVGQLVGIYGSETRPSSKEIVDWVKQGTSEYSEELSNTKVFPNPASDYILLPKTAEYVQLINSLGQIAWQGKIPEAGSIDISSLPVGIYYVIISSGTEVQKTKLIKID